MENDNIESIIKCYYYSTGLPIKLLSNGKLKISYPKDIKTADNLIKGRAYSPVILQNNKEVQIIQTEFKEVNFALILNKGKQIISVGPYLNKTIETGTITNMVRNGIIPFHQKSELQKYYQSLMVIGEEKTYYLIKTLKHMLSNKTNNEELVKDDIIYNIQKDSYYKQKDEYRQNSFLHSPYFIEQEISKSIRSGNVDNSKKLLKEINLQPHARLAASSLRSYKNSMICSCSYMTRAAIDGGVNPDDAFTLSDSFINQIENLVSIDELNSFEEKMVEEFSLKVKEVKEKQFSPTILNCIYYIDNHLCEDLSISVLSKAVYLNGSYLSNLFHKETGKTIKEWINNERIKESARLVLNSNEDIAEIAYFYKYCSQSYFIQCFKKVFGMTPNEYRLNKGN